MGTFQGATDKRWIYFDLETVNVYAPDAFVLVWQMKNKNASAWIINSITWEIKAESEFRTKHFVRLIETICSFVLRGHHIDETELLTSNTAGSKKRPSVACFSFDTCFFELINSCLQFSHISISQLSWCRIWTEEK